MVTVSTSSSISVVLSNRKQSISERSLIIGKYVFFLTLLVCLVVMAYNQAMTTTTTTQNDVRNMAPLRTRFSSISSSTKEKYNIQRQGGHNIPFDTNRMNENIDINYNCRYYMAESAIPNGGIALFTAIDLKEGDEAQPFPDVCIYVADTPEIRTSFHTHSWADSKFIGQFEGYNPRGACEGIATLVNHMPSFHTGPTSALKSMHHHTNGGLHRYYDPGAGAITQYYGITSKAIRNVSAGSELTIEYGDWESDPNEEYIVPERTVDWLHKYGMCVDNIIIQNATDPTMGRGAFARYDIKAGSLVSPAPLQIFSNRTIFAEQVPEALFVNYCFQPKNTNVLLFPYGPGVNLINHGSKDTANVKIEWSSHYVSHTPWLSLPAEQFWQMQYPGSILVDYIALRDIKAGEEIFLDYGNDWQEAWDDHVANWQPYIEVSNYTYVDEIDRTQPFRTIEEQETEPYSINLHTVCMTKNWDRDKYSVLRWKKPSYDFPRNLVYCSILERTRNRRTNEYEYTVALNFHPMEPELMDLKRYIDTHVPHWAISFVDKPYMSDLHLPNSFRHPIGLPEHMIHNTWLE